MPNPKIGIVGLGMVGHPLKRYFEKQGFARGKNLFCYDSDPFKKYGDDVKKAQILFVAVPTPSKKDGSCDTAIVESVVKKFAKTAKTIVIKSTVPPGTVEILAKKYKCPIIFNPEFLTEAKAWENTVFPDRQIAAPSLKARLFAKTIINLLPPAPFSSPRHKKAKNWAEISPTEAELGKYAANTFGALKVTFANIFYDLAKAMEIKLQKNNIKKKVSYENIRQVLVHDRRIGSSWLDARHGDYRGYGGYCFPKDTDAIMAEMANLIKSAPVGKARLLLAKGLKLFEAMRGYNQTLLASQGLNPGDVRRHDKELAKLIKKIKRNKV
jgi:UDPglucose 6-dehydrogenase